MEILSVAILGIMAGTLLLSRIPAKGCDECEHCLAERRETESRKQEETHRKMHAWYGRERCPICASES